MSNLNQKFSAQFKKDLADGEEFQDHVVDKLWSNGIVMCQYTSVRYQKKIGESRNGIEVKYDKQFEKTGNLYIEYEARSSPNSASFSPSGVFRPDNIFLWVIGDYENTYVFPKKYLKMFFKNDKLRKVSTYWEGIEMSRGYLIPKDFAEKYCILKI